MPSVSRSLRRQLFSWLVPAMLLLMVAGAITAYATALRHTVRAYDRALLDTAVALREQVQLYGDQISINLPAVAQQILTTDKYDQVFYEVRGPRGEFIAGHHHLPNPPRLLPEDGRMYYDGIYDGRPVRVAALFAEINGQPLLILAAETTTKREILVREILLGMLLPEIFLMLATLAMIWLGIRHGLTPLNLLRSELSHRSHLDLSPVLADYVPEEIRPLADEINRLLGRLEQSLQAQRHFVSDAAHQLRTPVAALQAQAEVALRTLRQEQDPAEAERALKAILTAAHRLTHLAHQLLALARAEPGGNSAQQALDLAEEAQTSAQLWLPAALRQQIDLGFDLTPTPITGSSLHLQELLGNLIDNALRHTPSGGSITVGCRPDTINGVAELWVEDSGPGVDEHTRDKVFERFWRAPDSPGDGCGLGLAIVQEIVNLHTGHISVERSSTLGGACFRVIFPLAGETGSENRITPEKT